LHLNPNLITQTRLLNSSTPLSPPFPHLSSQSNAPLTKTFLCPRSVHQCLQPAHRVPRILLEQTRGIYEFRMRLYGKRRYMVVHRGAASGSDSGFVSTIDAQGRRVQGLCEAFGSCCSFGPGGMDGCMGKGWRLEEVTGRSTRAGAVAPAPTQEFGRASRNPG